MQLTGIHHITAVSANISENLEFYTQVLGLRLVKKSVNQDDVSAYHLFYADKLGSPGTDMTFFDWPKIGPNLRGIVGRPAGSVEGYTYSNTMLKTLKGMEWTEAALNVWITNPQAWVPGVYMYYKQADPEIRRKIILYLKSNP